MKKQLISALLCTAMVATMITGCGASNEAAAPAAESSAAATETGEDVAAAAEKAAEGIDDPFYIYGWNDDVKNSVIKAFEEKYPEDAKRIAFVNTGGSDTYQTKIDALLENPDSPEYPDMFAMEMDYIMKYTDSDITMDVSELGITEDNLANMYPYTVEAATVDGKVKGVSWQACPGCFTYRRSLAQKYLGVSEPEDVQSLFKDWDTTFQTAQKIKDASKGECRLYCGYTELQRPYQAQRKEAWVDKDNNLVVDDNMLAYMKASKEYVDAGFASAGSADQQWNDGWAAKKGDDSIFGYTSCTWFNQWCLLGNFEENHPEAKEDWAMIQGPTNFYWGGTWLGVASGCQDKEMAAKVLSVLCDEDAMASIYKNTCDYPNNKKTVEKLIAANEENDVVKMLGGQNFLEFFAPIAENIKLPAMCGEDFYINNSFNDQINEYVNGNKDFDTAVADFKSTVADQYSYINVE